MIKKEVRFEFEQIESIKSCSTEIQKLHQKALEARENAYAPYSQFKVGAALLLDNGEIILGNNQENAAYPVGLCAERVAIFNARANFPSATFLALFIVTSAQKIQEPISPCGSCRQVMVECEFIQKKPFEIYLETENQNFIRINSAQNLLPFSFHADMLNA